MAAAAAIRSRDLLRRLHPPWRRLAPMLRRSPSANSPEGGRQRLAWHPGLETIPGRPRAAPPQQGRRWGMTAQCRKRAVARQPHGAGSRGVWSSRGRQAQHRAHPGATARPPGPPAVPERDHPCSGAAQGPGWTGTLLPGGHGSGTARSNQGRQAQHCTHRPRTPDCGVRCQPAKHQAHRRSKPTRLTPTAAASHRRNGQ